MQTIKSIKQSQLKILNLLKQISHLVSMLPRYNNQINQVRVSHLIFMS